MAERKRLSLEEWRARKQARRERERALSVERAKAMHLARLAREAAGEPAAARDAAARKRVAHVGCSGWFYWHWRGGIYPADGPTSAWFPIYARTFRTVELNAPFYSWPTLGTVARWARDAPAGFIYTVKVNDLITHEKRFVRTKTLVRDFGLIADLLGSHMGCFLFQLPPSVKYSRPMLRRILAQLDPRRRNVVEFRDRSWWRPEVSDAFCAAGAIFCSSSAPRLPDELVTTADDIYVRFHGIERWYRHDYSRAELAVWADRIEASGARRVYAYFNNDREGFAIQNARVLIEELKARGFAT
jgi:uncharacterized protein YecE (DUF72 family)